MFGDTITRGPCAWCHQAIPEPEPYAGTWIAPPGSLDADFMLKPGYQPEARGPFHFPECLGRFQAATGQVTAEHQG